MNDEDKQAAALFSLRCAIGAWAFAGLVGIPLAVLFDVGRGWRWSPFNAVYDQMIVSIYVALGVMMLGALRDPLANWSLLQFTVLSSVLHGLVMLVHAIIEPMHRGHLLGDVWILAGAASLAWPMRALAAAKGSAPRGRRRDGR